MKAAFPLLLLATALATTSYGQGTGVGIGTAAPAARAALEIRSDSAGLLIPRLTAAQRTGLTGVPQGLLVYQTDGTAAGGAQTGFWYYGGSSGWVYLNAGLVLPYSGAYGGAAATPALTVTHTGANGVALRGVSSAGTTGVGVLGVVYSGGSTATGVLGADSTGTSAGAGVTGSTAAGYGVLGRATGSGGYGVAGTATDSYGVIGSSSTGTGVYGTTAANSSSVAGVQGVSGSGSNAIGVLGSTTSGNGVRGVATAPGGYGVYGLSTSATGSTSTGVYGAAAGAGSAGYFAGSVTVTGNLIKAAGSFKIDHPLDPANKYLSHSFVESPDMMNVYNGTVTTDAQGFATVSLPDWFEALNRDFRYQLTVIGTFAQAIIKEKVTGNAFRIQTSVPNVEVSWQVTGIRHDPYADAHRIPLEEAKTGAERGRYLAPDAYGRPLSEGIGREAIVLPAAPKK